MGDWPLFDPPPWTTNQDPRPVDAPTDPDAIARVMRKAVAGGWEVRAGYSRGPMRARKTGTYKDVHTYGIWAAPHPTTGWRWYAMHERTVGAKTGWKWSRITVWKEGVRHGGLTVTGLEEFLKVRGSVLPSWFEQFKEVAPDGAT